MPAQGAAIEPCAKLALAQASRAEVASRSAMTRAVHALTTQGIAYAAQRAASTVGLAERPAAARVSEIPLAERSQSHRADESLDLQPGELVEVKSAEEIRATLDDRGMYRGLLFMGEMWRYAGQQLVVMKRIDSIMIESTSTLRTGIKNTVLLQGACCDGSDHGGCGANCYHLWREVWLRRVPA
ncbi:MAG TPA: hypothetical protein VLA05_09770 [Coriobacteriia bacterium]|nr:hypothetical protein [Coriobacteriia bacterium]